MFIAKNTNKIVLHMGAFILSASILTAESVMTINAAGEHPFTFTADTSGKEHCDQLASTGTIKDGTSGKVLFDSSDITTLAEGVNTANDRITDEEGQAKSFKDGIISSLGSIGTGSTDNSYTYSSPKDLTSDSDLGNFQNAINGSQAITGYPTGTKDADGNEITLDKMQATDKDGKLLYYTDDTALSTGDLTKTTTDTSKITLGTNTDGTAKTAGDYKVYYKPITADNLTAGSAGWVDGRCILGNGSDNTTLVNNKITKPIYLGSGTSFNVSKYTGYQNFTVDNFIVCALSANGGGGGDIWSDGSTGSGVSGGASTSISKSYNPNTGIITINGTSASSSSGQEEFQKWDGGARQIEGRHGNVSVGVGVYLIAN